MSAPHAENERADPPTKSPFYSGQGMTTLIYTNKTNKSISLRLSFIVENREI